MFNFIKKSLTASNSQALESREQEATLDTAVDEVLLGYRVGHVSIAKRLTGLERSGRSVTLDLRLPEDCDPERIHRELSQQFRAHGINEVNLNITIVPVDKAASLTTSSAGSKITKSARTKAASKTLPKTTDAMDNHAAPRASEHQAPMSSRAPTQASIKPHPRIDHIIVIASGKGGVGKSTTTVNIALALQKLGKRVGILDADIYGPSIPTMLGAQGIKPELENDQFVPIEARGLAMLSIGSLLDSDNTPVAWRGPKATGALMQLFNQTNWPRLDYLVIDMPPGTGDIQLTLAQRIPVTGAVIVTTPQHIALMDAQKGIEMFNKTSIPVLGVVENMALHTCSDCGHTEAIFGAGGGETIAKEYQVPLLGQLPLASGIRAQADNGEPSVIANEGAGDDFAPYYDSIAKKIEANISKFAKQRDDSRIF